MSVYTAGDGPPAVLPLPPVVRQQYRIHINCGDWDPEKLLARLRNGGCPHRHVVWTHHPTDNTIQATVELSEAGLSAMVAWLREPYVIPSELHIEFS